MQTTTTTTTTEYSSVVSTTLAAVTSTEGTEGKWEKVARIVPAFFGTAETLTEQKAQFIADAIAPALPKHSKALAVELPRKNSKEFKALDAGAQAQWVVSNDAKIAARATFETYFKRVLKYAFPTPKNDSDDSDDSDKSPKTLETKLAEAIADCIGKIEKAEAPAFDTVAALAGLRAALAVVTAAK